MKKLTIIALALCLAVVMAAPVMAVDADFSGAFRVRGAYVEQWNLDNAANSKDFMDMRFRLQTVFKASDNLAVTVRFDALDNKVWGDSDLPTGDPNDDNIDFDRAYMTIKADFGTFDIGRMSGGAWGTSFIDNETEKDRIKFTKTIDDLTLYLVYQKNIEADDDTAIAANDQDSETYYLLTKYKIENTTAGLLLAFTNDKNTDVDGGLDANETTRKYSAAPYFVSKFGPLAVQGELQYNWGTTEYDGATADLDYKELAYNIEASYNLGSASVMAGYAFISGDQSTADNEDGCYDDGVGNDWEKLFILTTNEIGQLVALGNYGNLSEDGLDNGTQNKSGAKIIYGAATFSALDNLTLGLVVGSAKADEAPATYDDDYGMEYDLTLNWKIYDNLTYTAIAAFLEAGDYFKQGVADATFDDTYALFHQLQLSF